MCKIIMWQSTSSSSTASNHLLSASMPNFEVQYNLFLVLFHASESNRIESIRMICMHNSKYCRTAVPRYSSILLMGTNGSQFQNWILREHECHGDEQPLVDTVL